MSKWFSRGFWCVFWRFQGKRRGFKVSRFKVFLGAWWLRSFCFYESLMQPNSFSIRRYKNRHLPLVPSSLSLWRFLSAKAFCGGHCCSPFTIPWFHRVPRQKQWHTRGWHKPEEGKSMAKLMIAHRANKIRNFIAGLMTYMTDQLGISSPKSSNETQTCHTLTSLRRIILTTPERHVWKFTVAKEHGITYFLKKCLKKERGLLLGFALKN